MISNQGFHVVRETNHLFSTLADAFDIRKQIRAGDKIHDTVVFARIVDDAQTQIHQLHAAFCFYFGLQFRFQILLHLPHHLQQHLFLQILMVVKVNQIFYLS